MAFALSPIDIPNKVFFLDGQDIYGDGNSTNQPVDGTNVINLIDKFNTNTGVQLDIIKQPIYSTNGINNFPSLTFDGVNDLLNIKENLTISNNPTFTEKSYVMLIKTGNDINTFQTIYDEGTKEKGFSFQIENGRIYAGAYNTIDWVSPNQFKTIDLGLVEINTIYKIIFIYDQTNDSIKGYLDGTLINTLNNISLQTTYGACNLDTSFGCTIYDVDGTIAVGSTKNDTLKLSNNSQVVGFESNPFLGNIGEISSYNHALTETEIIGLDDYLNNKWGLDATPGKIFHFDAQNTDGDFINTNEPVNGTALSTWIDINKGYNATQLTVGSEPIYSTNIINGHSALKFNGLNNLYNIDNQIDINTAASYSQKSFSMILKTGNDVNSLQTIYEQGGGVRGYSIQIDNGNMYMGAWNNAEWLVPNQYKFINLGAILPNTVYNILLIQNSISGVDTTNTLSAYIDGNLAGILDTVDIQRAHGGNIKIASSGGTIKYDGTSLGNGSYFNGYIGEFISWNHALNTSEIAYLNNYLNQKWSLDIISPVISSSNINNNSILPGGNHSIDFNYSDNIGGTGININTSSITLEKWNGSSWISNTNITQNSINNIKAIYTFNNLSFGKYRTIFNISDNIGNISLNYETIFYIDEPQLIISTGSINIGSLDDTITNFGNIITVTVKTIGAPFSVKLKNNQDLISNNLDIITAYNGNIGIGYDKNGDGSLVNYDNEVILSNILNINTNGDLNTYTYDLKIGSLINTLQESGDYSGIINFGINLNY